MVRKTEPVALCRFVKRLPSRGQERRKLNYSLKLIGRGINRENLLSFYSMLLDYDIYRKFPRNHFRWQKDF